jgi:hypothetical protein
VKSDKRTPNRLNRRDLLQTAGRAGLGAGLAAVAAMALRRGADRNGQAPCDPAACKGCRIAKTCNLPPAQTHRKDRSL